MASRTLIPKLFHLTSTLPSPLSFRSTSLVLLRHRLGPFAIAACDIISPSSAATSSSANIRCFSTRPTVSSLNDQSPNFSNRPPKETILLDGCDFEHWLVVMDPPENIEATTRDEIIDSYIKTLAQVLGSEEEARMKIYSVSTRHYYAFGALVSEELSYKIKTLPKVRWVLPDSYLDVKNKDYGGEPFIDGKAVPYDPKYHEEWVRNNARANERSRRSDRPRNADRSRNFERRRDVGPPMPNQDFQRGPNPIPQNATPQAPPPNRDFNQMPLRENPNMGGGMPNRNAPPPPPPPPSYQNSVPNPNYQGNAYGQQGGGQGYPGGAPAYHGGAPGGYPVGNQGVPGYQGGSPPYQGGGGGGSPSYQGGAPAYQGGGGGGSPSYRGGVPAYQGGGGGAGSPSYQGSAPAYQGGGGGAGSPSYQGPAYQGGGGGGGGGPSHQNYPGGNPSNNQSGAYPGGAGPNYQAGGNAFQGGPPDHQVREMPGRDH